MKATPPDGLLLLDKPSGRTSHDVVAAVRRVVGRSVRVGHSGTLDPLATGLVLVGIGGATRLQQFLTGLDKSYTGTLRLGTSTTTWDADGEPVAPAADPASVDSGALATAAAGALGEVDQLAPPYSAKKVGGRKLYELARKGEDVPEVRKRVTVSRFDVGREGGADRPFAIDCSSGTYVRTLVHELGVAVSVGAHVATLRRTRIGSFALADALPLESWLALPPELRFTGAHFLRPADIPLGMPRIRIDAAQVESILHGKVVLVPAEGLEHGTSVALLGPDGSLRAIGEVGGSGRIGGIGGIGDVVPVQPRIVLGADTSGGAET